MIGGAINHPYRLYRQLLRMYGKQNWWPARTKFEVVIGAILTQQTSWSNVEKAIRKLRRSGLMNMRSLGNANMRMLQACIYPTGFYRQKARRIRSVTNHLLKKTNGNLDKLLTKPLAESRVELLALNGIGKETADSILLYAGGQMILPVDAYTMRMMKRVEGRKGTYDTIQNYLQECLPRTLEIYREFHALVVKHSKRTCLKKKPHCLNCTVHPCNYRSESNWGSDRTA